MSTLTISPAPARRSIASQMWGNIQQTYRLGKGVSLYLTDGHGGIVADASCLPDTEQWQKVSDALKAAGMLERVEVVRASYRRNRTLITKNYRYSPESVVSSHDMLIGEEDCAWATVVLVLDKLGVPLNLNAGFSPENHLPRDERIAQARQSALRWNPDIVKLLDDIA
jgi:hypothetical protein